MGESGVRGNSVQEIAHTARCYPNDAALRIMNHSTFQSGKMEVLCCVVQMSLEQNQPAV